MLNSTEKNVRSDRKLLDLPKMIIKYIESTSCVSCGKLGKLYIRNSCVTGVYDQGHTEICYAHSSCIAFINAIHTIPGMLSNRLIQRCFWWFFNQ